MAILDLVAKQGSGKTECIKLLTPLCNKPYAFACHRTMTSTAFRNLLLKAKNRTAIIEEGNLYPNKKEIESYLINRVDKKGTASITTNQQVVTPSGAKRWRTESFHVFGATIVHDRLEMIDRAAERRTISINIKYSNKGQFLKAAEATDLSKVETFKTGWGDMPFDYILPEVSGSAIDAWEPLIRIANHAGDKYWLDWAWGRLVEVKENLAEGEQFEIDHVIFGSMVKALLDSLGITLVKLQDAHFKKPLPLSAVTKLVAAEQGEWMHPKAVSTQLKKMGIKNRRNYGGTSHIYTSLEEVRKVAENIGYNDDSL